LSAFWNSSWFAAVTSETAGRDCLNVIGNEHLIILTRRLNLLDHVADDAIGLARAVVFGGSAVFVDFQSPTEKL
jgi:hypothetical protein